MDARAPLVESFPCDHNGQIHVSDVIGPEMSVALSGAPPNAVLNVRAWIVLS